MDTAGIRRKTKINEKIEYYSVNRAIKSIALADIVYLVIDSLEDVSEQDKKISDQIVKKGKGLIIVLNKWDLMKDKKISLEEKKDFLFFKFPLLKYVPILAINAMIMRLKAYTMPLWLPLGYLSHSGGSHASVVDAPYTISENAASA